MGRNIRLFRGLLTLGFYKTFRHSEQLTQIVLFFCLQGLFWSELQNILKVHKIDRTWKWHVSRVSFYHCAVSAVAMPTVLQNCSTDLPGWWWCFFKKHFGFRIITTICYKTNVDEKRMPATENVTELEFLTAKLCAAVLFTLWNAISLR